MHTQELYDIAAKMVAPGKGILAADESDRSAKKRLEAVGVGSTEETRRQYRDLFLSADGIEQYLSGVILYDETIRQKANDGTLFPQLLEKKGIVPGIKVDTGAKDLPGFPNEKITSGLDGLPERLKEYHEMGARFAKWRAVITIGDGIPTQECLDANGFVLAQYARNCQEAGIVPMVEPEVLLNGTHDIKRAYKETSRTLQAVFGMMKKYRVDLRGTILKTSMIVPGDKSGQDMNNSEVGRMTAKCLKKNVPKELGGVVFLSGGQSAEDATKNLNEVAKNGPYPWGVTFSYARALQGPALKIWKGDGSKVPEARAKFLERLRSNSDAQQGKRQ